ncbi:Sirohydrochlorin cobaltochelatase CbiX-like [Dillenia turbinata]|uniref:Sirohydrochlorin cobaltochelatase CbiX-like n=1 Tax=Dillenia turbinata TaxID=194707 RepID=A0AAN8V4R4_9MAGN
MSSHHLLGQTYSCRLKIQFPSLSSPKRLSIRENRADPPLNFVRFEVNFLKSNKMPTKLCAMSAADNVVSEVIKEKDAVIIVDHGSRRKESNLMLNEFVAMFRDKTGYAIVEPAHMELAEPSIKSAFRACVEQGANRVILSPFFLFPGRHWHQDIPSLMAEAAKEHPGVSYVITAPLGLHELLVDVVKDRIKHCLSHVAGDAEACDVCTGTDKCRLYNLAKAA